MFFLLTSDGDKGAYVVTSKGRYHIPTATHWQVASKLSRGDKLTQSEMATWDEIFKPENLVVAY